MAGSAAASDRSGSGVVRLGLPQLAGFALESQEFHNVLLGGSDTGRASGFRLLGSLQVGLDDVRRIAMILLGELASARVTRG